MNTSHFQVIKTDRIKQTPPTREKKKKRKKKEKKRKEKKREFIISTVRNINTKTQFP